MADSRREEPVFDAKQRREPNITRRGGKYIVRWRDHNGRSRKATLATLADARTKRNQELATRAGIKSGIAVPEPQRLDITLDQLIAEYDRRRPATSRGARTVRCTVGRDLEKLGRRRVKDLTERDLEGVIGQWKSRKLKPNSIRKYEATLATMMNCAVKWGYLMRSPMQGVERVKVGEERHVYYTPAQLDAIVGECRRLRYRGARFDGTDLALLVEFAASSGLRSAEMALLDASDWSWDNAACWVRPENAKNGNGRWAYFPRRLVERLQNAVERGWVAAMFPSDAVDIRTRMDAFKRPFAQVIVRLGLSGTWHTLRHTFGSHLAIGGVAPMAIRDLMGHKSLRQTERYARLNPDVWREAVERL